MRTLFAIILGKIIFFLTRILKIGGGFAAPGLYALKFEPNLIEKLINHQATNIVITGTNGKTTTSKIIADILKTAKHKVLRNSSGSNLERGIASYLIKHSDLFGRLDYDFGVWEADEFAFNTLVPKIKPDVVIFLNVFRDQLDRYGEVDNVVKKWGEALGKLNLKTLVIANSDDGNLNNLLKSFKGKILSFGVKDSKIIGESLSSKKADYEAEILNTRDLANTEFKIKFKNGSETFRIPLPGVFNVYNFLSAFILVRVLNLDPKIIDHSLKNFSPAFGRFERFEIPGGKNANIFLIKNPAGATQVLQTILPHISTKDTLLMALNDNLADGRDVSWIWDIEMEKCKVQSAKCRIIVTGSRSYDLSLRLKYAGITEMTIEPDLGKSFNLAVKESQGKLFILPTYTALLELQKLLVKKGIKKEYWRE